MGLNGVSGSSSEYMDIDAIQETLTKKTDNASKAEQTTVGSLSNLDVKRSEASSTYESFKKLMTGGLLTSGVGIGLLVIGGLTLAAGGVGIPLLIVGIVASAIGAGMSIGGLLEYKKLNELKATVADLEAHEDQASVVDNFEDMYAKVIPKGQRPLERADDELYTAVIPKGQRPVEVADDDDDDVELTSFSAIGSQRETIPEISEEEDVGPSSYTTVAGNPDAIPELDEKDDV